MYDLVFRAARIVVIGALLAACGSDSMTTVMDDPPLDPENAPRVAVDRFSSTAGMLFVRRDATNGLPAANAPIDMDTGPFITSGFGPSGQHIKYYNFDVQPTAPAPIYVLVRQGETNPVHRQAQHRRRASGATGLQRLLAGDEGDRSGELRGEYRSRASDEIRTKGYAVEATNSIVNCPIVPEGSVARLGGGAHGLTHGWWDQVVAYFNFDEAAIAATTPDSCRWRRSLVSFTTKPGSAERRPGIGVQDGARLAADAQCRGSSSQDKQATARCGPSFRSITAAFDIVHDLATAGAGAKLGHSGERQLSDRRGEPVTATGNAAGNAAGWGVLPQIGSPPLFGGLLGIAREGRTQNPRAFELRERGSIERIELLGHDDRAPATAPAADRSFWRPAAVVQGFQRVTG